MAIVLLATLTHDPGILRTIPRMHVTLTLRIVSSRGQRAQCFHPVISQHNTIWGRLHTQIVLLLTMF